MSERAVGGLSLAVLLVRCSSKDDAIRELCQADAELDAKLEMYRAWCGRQRESVLRSDLARITAASPREFQRPLFD